MLLNDWTGTRESVKLCPGAWASPAIPARAQELGERLAQAARCDACHRMTEPLLGPPYIAIAARHAARRDVMLDVLAHRIVHGGGGNWGVVPMVPNQWVSMGEARIIAEWILNLSAAP